MYLRLVLVVAEEYRHGVELTIRRTVGDAVRIISVCRSIDEARVRAALLQPDVIVVGPCPERGDLETLLGPDAVSPPLLIVWQENEDPNEAVSDRIAGRFTAQSSRDAVVSLFESCARHIAQRRLMRTTTVRHPEAVYRADIIALPHQNWIDVRRTETIIHVKGEGNYTQVAFDNGGNMLMSRTIGDYEDVLPASTFLRVHRSHIINIHHVRKIVRGKIMRVILSNGDEVEVSEGKRDQLLGMINIVRRR